MSRTKISQYSAVANDNTDVNGININEGCPPSSMNNMGREIMAALKRFQVGSDGDGVTVGGSLVVSGSTSVNTFNVDVISEKTSAAGVTVDGVLLKDSGVVTGAGTVSAPVYSTTGDLNTGIFFPAADTIAFAEGGSERMRIDSSGNVGIGTTSPSSFGKLAVSGLPFSSSYYVTSSSGGGSGGARFGSYFGSVNVGYVDVAVTDGTGGAEKADVRFGTINSGTLAERMRIDSSGNLLIGTTSFVGAGGMTFSPSAAGPRAHYAGSATTNSNTTHEVYSTGVSAYRFYVGYGGTIFATSTSISAISDATLKENVRNLETGLNEVMALRPRRFDWKNGDAQDVAGFVAQEVEQVLPELVQDYVYNKDNDGNDIIKKSLKMGDILPTLVNAIQQQQAIIQALTERVAALEAK